MKLPRDIQTVEDLLKEDQIDDIFETLQKYRNKMDRILVMWTNESGQVQWLGNCEMECSITMMEAVKFALLKQAIKPKKRNKPEQ